MAESGLDAQAWMEMSAEKIAVQLQGSMVADWDPRCGGEKMRSNG